MLRFKSSTRSVIMLSGLLIRSRWVGNDALYFTGCTRDQSASAYINHCVCSSAISSLVCSTSAVTVLIFPLYVFDYVSLHGPGIFISAYISPKRARRKLNHFSINLPCIKMRLLPLIVR